MCNSLHTDAGSLHGAVGSPLQPEPRSSLPGYESSEALTDEVVEVDGQQPVGPGEVT